MKQTVGEAAHSFAESRSSGSMFPAYYDGFIAGAEWQSKQSHWISVEDQLPNHNTSVLTKGAYGFLICSLSTLGEWQTGANVNKERLAISHWTPIPPFYNK